MTTSPTENTAPESATAARDKSRRGPSISRFITSVQDLVKRNPILSVLSVVVLFLVGWFAETSLDRVWSKWFPDAEQVRAQVLRERIDEKTGKIATTIASMEASLAEARDEGSGSEAFMSAARQVIEELETLRPEITEFADNADRFTQRLADAKAGELASTGQSALADFVLPLRGGMTLCPTRYTFSANGSHISGHIALTLSQDGINETEHVTPGEGARLDTDSGGVSVSYLGPTPDGETHRFNFACHAA